jgi:hypothetical protein
VNGGARLRTATTVAVALATALLATASSGAGAPRAAAAGAEPAARGPAGVTFSAARGRLVITAPAYRLSLSKRNGAIVELVDRETGARLVTGQNGCLWGAVPASDAPPVGGCGFAPGARDRFSYRWDPRASTLLLVYDGDNGAERRVETIVGVTAGQSSFDLRLLLESHWGRTLSAVIFPAHLLAVSGAVKAGYAPHYLPGLRLEPGFFSRVGNNVFTYPSRWAFADYLGLDIARAHFALYSVNLPSARIAPADIGFIHNAEPGPCSGRAFCVMHAFQAWIADGARWTSPIVRIRVGGTVEDSILAYREANGIGAYPSLQAKLGSRLDALSRAPLIKADLWKGLPPFNEWVPSLRRLPSPALLHPVSFQPGGHDESFPDFLPPDPRWGTSEDLVRTIGSAHALGQLVMPYLNVSWWDDGSPTVRRLPAPLGLADIAVHNFQGLPVSEQFDGRNGYLASPYVPFVGKRIASLLEQWRSEVPVDCLFFDQIGARPWRRDFNPASPSPLAYADGWLELLAPYADRCLMVEDGWDRLAESFVGFHGSALLQERGFEEPTSRLGAGNWKPFPLALWLFHDKVLMYQHDLYERTMTADPEVLLWNAAFGFMLSYNWDGDAETLDSPWLELVGSVQRALGPRVAGKRLTGFREVAPDVTEAVFEDTAVLANWSGSQTYVVDGYGVAPRGFLARTRDGAVVAGAVAGSFAGVPLSPGTHYFVLERSASGVTLSQPLGRDASLSAAAERVASG